MSAKLKKFIINSISVASGSVIFRVLSIYFNSYISKKIGTEMLGLFHLVVSVYVFGITLGNFGINFAVTRLVSEELAVGNYNGIKKISKFSIILSFITGLFASFIILISSDFIISRCLHEKISKKVIYLICTSLPFISMSSAISGYFVAVRRVYKSTIAQFFEQIIKIFITAFILNLFLPNGVNYACFSLILGDIISEIFSFFCNFLLYKNDIKEFKIIYETLFSAKFYTQKILKISTPIAITSLIRSGLSTIKQLIIPLSFEKGKINCNKALSIYGEINGMAMPLVIFPNLLFSSISGLLIPEFATYNTNKQTGIIKKITKKILVISSISSFIISIFLFIFADNLNKLIYNTNSNITFYIKILSPISILILLDSVVDNMLKGLNAQNDVMIINIVDLAINIVIISTIIPCFGISGYIFAMYFSEIFNLILSINKLLIIISK